jgi:hypothetical protein
MPADWSREEVEAIVSDYLAMLEAELRGVAVDKTAHRRALLPRLNSRSEGSIEFKHQNISAVLLTMGIPYINGYKRRSNYQHLLEEVVAEQLRTSPGLLRAAEESVDREPPPPLLDEILTCVTSPPAPSRHESSSETRSRPAPPRFDYLEREAANRSLGLHGEEFVISFEQARLVSLGKDSLASRIEHVARTRGDSEGFDVLSFDATGRERFIEVKSTKHGKETPFFVTRNQVQVSETRRSAYHVYRVFQFGARPLMYQLHGAISDTCALDPATYVARIA